MYSRPKYPRTSFLSLAIIAALAIALRTPAYAQTTWYVDDNAINDPGPGDPAIGDPTEDGSIDHPFDAIQEAIDASTNGDTVDVADGTYTGIGNKNITYNGKAITVRSTSGNPSACIIDCQFDGRGFTFSSGETYVSLLTGFTITGGNNTTSGGAIRCVSASSPSIDNCIISDNVSRDNGGGIYCSSSSPTVTNCIISHNNCIDNGGALFCTGSSPSIRNCLIVENHAQDRTGGMYCYNNSSPTITNCTIANNSAFSAVGGAIYSSSSHPTITNTILWGDDEREIYVYNGGITVTYSDIQGGYNGIGNIDANPAFVTTSDFHLSEESPCIDTGTNGPTGGLPSIDLDGSSRPQDGNNDGTILADIGAYEFSTAIPDCNANGIHDASDIAEGTSADCNGNTIPDECEFSDCNDNKILDECDIDLGTSIDCNGNTIPDECDIASGLADDNGNGLLDLCEFVHNITQNTYYITIQEAIDDSVNGDELDVSPRIYYERVNLLGKAITLRSTAGPGTTIIDANQAGRAVSCNSGEGPSTLIEGFTLTNGSGPGVYCVSSSPLINNCVITNNSGSYGGGIYCEDGSNPLITNCVVRESYGYAAAAIYCHESDPTIVNCLIVDNYGIEGGGIGCYSASPSLINCIITQNTAANSEADLIDCSANSHPIITNCVIWDNDPFSFHVASSSVTVTYSDIQGGHSGTGNFSVNPRFVASDDYRLQASSPCIDMGTNSVTVPPEDLDGNPRVADGDVDGIPVIDVGAYEFQPDLSDCDSNGIPDVNEEDFDGDGLIDACDDDIDDDQVSNQDDVCDYSPLGSAVQADGSLRADINGDCYVDLTDLDLMVNAISGPILQPGPISMIPDYTAKASFSYQGSTTTDNGPATFNFAGESDGYCYSSGPGSVSASLSVPSTSELVGTIELFGRPNEQAMWAGGIFEGCERWQASSSYGTISGTIDISTSYDYPYGAQLDAELDVNIIADYFEIDDYHIRIRRAGTTIAEVSDLSPDPVTVTVFAGETLELSIRAAAWDGSYNGQGYDMTFDFLCTLLNTPPTECQPGESTILGDIDNDCDVDLADFAVFQEESTGSQAE